MKDERRSVRILALVTVGLAGLACAGCASRTLTITQGERINNAMHHYRPVDQRSGDPLEVSIVCVYPEDLERDENAGLKPRSGITCRDWYDHQPLRSGGKGERFNLPPEQIYLLTDAVQRYGQKRGPALKGAINDGRSEITISGIQFRGTKLHKRDSVIYVFPKFIDPNGKVLPVRAVEFNPPGAYTSKLSVTIGVDERQENYGQYVQQNTTRRRLFGFRRRE